MIWTSPGGQTYTTHPGSRLHFPSLCKPTGPVSVWATLSDADPKRGLMMPRRKHTRDYHQRRSIQAERDRNRVMGEDPENACQTPRENPHEDPYFPSQPRPPGPDEDPPPF